MEKLLFIKTLLSCIILFFSLNLFAGSAQDAIKKDSAHLEKKSTEVIHNPEPAHQEPAYTVFQPQKNINAAKLKRKIKVDNDTDFPLALNRWWNTLDLKAGLDYPKFTSIEEENAYKSVFYYRIRQKEGDVDALQWLKNEAKSSNINALQWYKEAAEAGNLDAQKTLGEMYQHGNGVTKNLKKSLKWYQNAAKQGDANAQYQLGLIYRKGGWGLKKSMNKAKFWNNKAATQSHKKALIFEKEYQTKETLKNQDSIKKPEADKPNINKPTVNKAKLNKPEVYKKNIIQRNVIRGDIHSNADSMGASQVDSQANSVTLE
ncbi:tetratricopeptide repeat protein [Candidatus Venteria ishoeyi]|uniref:Localization factor PodJL n=1 Tax=Candidatus Venteria ishoeyi TaxID=1899563 RepID=A0A1H6F421_9GAMM|nr:tetratricopeptide repeat protein [Candidatus Venteria ishoeyi]SEH04870.1 Localization factor PodJL [Candidatus Venteria ishoeyi]